MKSPDINKKRSYELACFIAAKLVANPALIENGRRYLEQYVKPDPRQRRYYEMWSALLKAPAEEIAARLVARSAEGDLLRDTRPVFYVPTEAERRRIFDKALSAET